MNTTDCEIIDRLLHKAGIGKRLLEVWRDFPTLAQNLDAADVTDKQRETLSAALQIQYVREATSTINSPADAAAILSDLQGESQENLVVLCLNTRNDVMARETVYKGSVNMSQIRIAEVFRSAIVRKCSAIIVAHNHPSGDPTPSPDDVAVTRAMVKAGKLLDIEVLDHIVIGQRTSERSANFVSLKERGLGFSTLP